MKALALLTYRFLTSWHQSPRHPLSRDTALGAAGLMSFSILFDLLLIASLVIVSNGKSLFQYIPVRNSFDYIFIIPLIVLFLTIYYLFFSRQAFRRLKEWGESRSIRQSRRDKILVISYYLLSLTAFMIFVLSKFL